MQNIIVRVCMCAFMNVVSASQPTFHMEITLLFSPCNVTYVVYSKHTIFDRPHFSTSLYLYIFLAAVFTLFVFSLLLYF